MNVSGLLLTKSTITVIPLKTVPAQLFTWISLILIGHPFFKTSFAWGPFICITALECEISVTAKFLSSHLSLIELMIFFLT